MEWYQPYWLPSNIPEGSPPVERPTSDKQIPLKELGRKIRQYTGFDKAWYQQMGSICQQTGKRTEVWIFYFSKLSSYISVFENFWYHQNIKYVL